MLVLCFLIGLIVWGVLFGPKKTPLSNPLTLQPKLKEIVPSETFKEYFDPSGFTFSYPDNLSIVKKDLEDNNTYADLQLASKEVNGSLLLKISDSSFATLDDWLKLNQAATQASKEVKLGNLKAVEVKTNDRLLLGALDKGVFFSIEVPLIEQDFWMKVYNQVLTDFSFTAPETVASEGNINDSSTDVVFEGEDVVE